MHAVIMHGFDSIGAAGAVKVPLKQTMRMTKH